MAPLLRRLASRSFNRLPTVRRFLHANRRHSTEIYTCAQLSVIQSHFDDAFYTEANPSASARSNPFQHFMDLGWRERYNPSRDFDVDYYLSENPDVHASGMNPLAHYALFGRGEGRAPNPSGVEQNDRVSSHETHAAVKVGDADLERVRLAFDTSFYLDSYPDVRKADIDPFLHYMSHGWREGRNPSSTFDTKRYLSLHDDVRQAGHNPLLHYVLRGRVEGRSVVDLNDPRTMIERATSPSERARGWLRDLGPATLTWQDLASRLLPSEELRVQGLVISISHDDYIENVGGTQNIIGDEMRALVQAGYAYLHLCPGQPLPMLAPLGCDEMLMNVRLNGCKLGLVRFSDAIKALGVTRCSQSVCIVVVHHLLGHRPEDVASLVATLNPDRVFAFLHDYFAFCISYPLLRNDVAHCNAPDVSSGSCRVCCYGQERRSHLARMEAFFAEVRPTMCIYSDAARELWAARSQFGPLDILQVRLARVELNEPVETSAAVVAGSAPLRIGFLGTPAYLKGWNVFASLAQEFDRDPRYEFVQLSSRAVHRRNVMHVPVSVTLSDRLAMVRALREAAIDVALIWSLWPETFCFTAYEAMAAGSFVITCYGSGNVWPGVEAQGPRQGIRLNSAEELRELFVTGDVVALSCAPGRLRGKFIVESPLADYILRERLGHDHD